MLASVSTNPLGERLVRAACRLADELNAERFVLHVETAAQSGFSSAQRAQVARTLELAEQFASPSV